MDGPAGSTWKEHVNEDVLELYAMGRLGNSKLAEVEEHVLACEQCQQRVDEIDGFVKAFQQASRELPEKAPAAEKDETGKLWAWLKPVWAASAALAAVMVVVMVAPRRPGVDPQNVDLRAMRGEGASQIEAEAGRPLVLRLDADGLEGTSEFQVELVEVSGRTVWKGAATKEARVEVTTPAVSGGTYWVRLLGPRGETLREFGLRVK